MYILLTSPADIKRITAVAADTGNSFRRREPALSPVQISAAAHVHVPRRELNPGVQASEG